MDVHKPVDEHGTPIRGIYAPRVHGRLMAEMLGLVKGMICDGVLTDGESVALHQWLVSHPDAAVHFPGNVLSERVQAMLRDGIIDEDERSDLADLMRAFAGESEDQSGDMNRATRLPMDIPPPDIFFDNREFVFTGVFAFGKRGTLENEVRSRGGRCHDSVRKGTSYLVVGINASAAWIHGDRGRKIEEAVALREAGRPIAIVAEEHWVEAIAFNS
jgi:hypothetical protein